MDTFTNNADGNMTSVSDATGYTLYVFDGENRLVEVRPNAPASGQKRVTMAYDFMGRRISKSVSSWNNNEWSPVSSRTFTWDGWLMTDETATASNSTSDTTSYVWGLGLSQTLTGAAGVGGLISMIRGNPVSSEQYFYCADGNGNISALVSDSGAMSAAYEYDAFGAILRSVGPMSSINTIGFSTKPLDIESNLIIFPYRAYNAAIGKFITSDPAESAGGLNVYTYVTNTPVNAVDPFGLWKHDGLNIWTAELGDDLTTLAKKYNAEPDDWQCLWPYMGTKDNGYTATKVKPCDRYDASNLAKNDGKKLYYDVSSDTPNGFKGKQIIAGDVPVDIQRESNEGKTPISFLLIDGHAGDVNPRMGGSMIYDSNKKRLRFIDPPNKKWFNKNAYNSLFVPNISFERAKKKNGPKRCWFTRNARVWFAGCHSWALASDFALIALRKSAYSHGTRFYSGINPSGITWDDNMNTTDKGGHEWKKSSHFSNNWQDYRAWYTYQGKL